MTDDMVPRSVVHLRREIRGTRTQDASFLSKHASFAKRIDR